MTQADTVILKQIINIIFERAQTIIRESSEGTQESVFSTVIKKYKNDNIHELSKDQKSFFEFLIRLEWTLVNIHRSLEVFCFYKGIDIELNPIGSC